MIETRLLFGGGRSISAITMLYDKCFERLPHVHREGGWVVSGKSLLLYLPPEFIFLVTYAFFPKLRIGM